MKTIGLIGGMSWESTVPYYRIINETVKERLGGLHSAELVLYSVDFQPIEQLQHAGKWDETANMLVRAAQAVEAAAAECVALCTNTMHRVAPAIQQAVGIPFLHIAEATGVSVSSQGIETVALLGTKFTMEQEFYRGFLETKFGLRVLIPEQSEREDIHRIIYDELCLGQVRDESRTRFADTIGELAHRGAEGVILGCTEISLLVGPSESTVPLFDTTRLHARHIADWALGGSVT
jgi:aspartate racemase